MHKSLCLNIPCQFYQAQVQTFLSIVLREMYCLPNGVTDEQLEKCASMWIRYCCHAEELLLIWVTPVWHAMWVKREKKDLSCLTESRATPTWLTLLQLLWVDANRDIPPSAPQRYIVTPGLSDNTEKNDQSIIILTCSFYCPGLYTIQDRKGSP